MKQAELTEYQNRLRDLQTRLWENVERLCGTILSEDAPAGEHDGRVSEAITKEVVLEGAEENLRRQVGQALHRLQEGRFGICERCGRAIDSLRLEAIPYTAYCVDCALVRERSA